jgi:hypothetical protein
MTVTTSSATTTGTTTGTTGSAGGPSIIDTLTVSHDRLDATHRAPRWTRWVLVGCAGLITVGAVGAVVVRHGAAPATSSSPSAAAIGAVDPAAAAAGREWEQRALTPAQAPARGLALAASTAPVVTAAPTTHGTGHGRLLVSP